MYGIMDMHCDTLSRILGAEKEGRIIELRSNDGHLDLERMKAAGYWMQTFAAFVGLKDCADPMAEALSLIDCFYEQMEKNRDLIRPVTTAEEVCKNQSEGRMSALLSIEEGGVCRGNLAYLRDFYRLGVRMMTLTWNYENELAFPNTVPEGGASYLGVPNTTQGLTDTGLAFLAEMERLGMILDVSHLGDAGFYDVYQNTTKPFIASHSNARSVCGHVRNMTDDMIKKLAERGGLMGINLCASFTEEAATEEETFGTIAGLVRHVQYIKNLAGIECIGIGTDYDGIGNRVELNECSKMPLFMEGMERAGLTASEIEAICHGNLLRVMKDVL